jgi:hypothetical protein
MRRVGITVVATIVAAYVLTAAVEAFAFEWELPLL